MLFQELVQPMCYQPKKVMNGRSRKAIIQMNNEGVVPTRADLSKPFWTSAEEQAFYMKAAKLEMQQVHIPVNIFDPKFQKRVNKAMLEDTEAIDLDTREVSQETASMDATEETSMEVAEMEDVETVAERPAISADICPHFHAQFEWARKAVESTGYYEKDDQDAPRYKARVEEEPKRKSYYEPRSPRSPRSPTVPLVLSKQNLNQQHTQSLKVAYKPLDLAKLPQVIVIKEVTRVGHVQAHQQQQPQGHVPAHHGYQNAQRLGPAAPLTLKSPNSVAPDPRGPQCP
eukprot:gene35682-44002_t